MPHTLDEPRADQRSPEQARADRTLREVHSASRAIARPSGCLVEVVFNPGEQGERSTLLLLPDAEALLRRLGHATNAARIEQERTDARFIEHESPSPLEPPVVADGLGRADAGLVASAAVAAVCIVAAIGLAAASAVGVLA